MFQPSVYITVTVIAPNGCTSSTTAIVTGDTAAPDVTALGGTITCSDNSVILVANTSGTIIGWTGPNNFSSNLTSPVVTLAGTYSVTVMGANGCGATATAQVLDDTNPPTVTTTGGTLTCANENITLVANTSGTIIGWTGPGGYSTDLTAPSVSTDGTYTVTVQAENGCTSTAVAIVESDQEAPNVSATGGILTCDQVNVNLNVITNGSVVGWTGPNGFSSNLASPIVSVTGIYTVNVQSSNGCVATATAIVSGDTTAPTVSATGGILDCNNTSVILGVNTDGNVVGWTGPNGYASSQTSPSVLISGTYTVTVQGENGCMSTATAEVTGDTSLPDVNITGGSLSCSVTSLQLITTTNGSIIGWIGPNGYSSNEASPIISVAGLYTVTVQAANGCTTTASSLVNSDTDLPIVDATGGILTCTTPTTSLVVSTNGSVIGWTGPNGFNSDLASPSVSEPGIYTVTVEGVKTDVQLLLLRK